MTGAVHPQPAGPPTTGPTRGPAGGSGQSKAINSAAHRLADAGAIDPTHARRMVDRALAEFDLASGDLIVPDKAIDAAEAMWIEAAAVGSVASPREHVIRLLAAAAPKIVEAAHLRWIGDAMERDEPPTPGEIDHLIRTAAHNAVVVALQQERATIRQRIEELADSVQAHLELHAEPWEYADGVARDATIRAAMRASDFIRGAAVVLLPETSK